MNPNNLATRTLSGAIFVAIVVGATLFAPWSFIALLAMVCGGCMIEFFRLTTPGASPLRQAGLVFGAMVYIVLPLALLIALYAHWGRWMVLLLFLIIWANDTFAYLVGVACGKHKMAPHLSPKKSWEGFAGGLAGAIGMAIGGAQWLYLTGGVVVWAGFGLLVALGAVAGDLFESGLKRRAGVKDAGSVLPGHGGFLDRFDSLLFAAPCAVIYLLIYAIVS